MEEFTKIKYGKEDFINNKIAFVHVPKTGGALIKHFSNDLFCHDEKLEHISSSNFKKHNHDHVFFTMIRHPYDRACSEYFYIKRKLLGIDGDVSPWSENIKKRLANILLMSIEEFLESFISDNYANSSIYSHYFDLIKINDFDFVGCTEEMPKSLNLIYLIFNKKIKNIYINKNTDIKNGNIYNFKYSKKDFIKKYYIDYNIYMEGLDKFNKIFSLYTQ